MWKCLIDDPNWDVKWFLIRQAMRKPTDPGIQIIVSRDYESGKTNTYIDLKKKGLLH